MERPCLPFLRARLTLSLLLAAATMQAQTAEDTPPKAAETGVSTRRIENTFAFVLNPLGIQDAFDVSWARSISNRQDLLFRDAHVAVGVSNKLTPAFERLGAWFEYSPLSILDLRVGVEPVYYFGTDKAFLPFNRIDARFDDEVIEARVDEAAAGFAGRAYFSPTLKVRLGPFVGRLKAEISRFEGAEERRALLLRAGVGHPDRVIGRNRGHPRSPRAPRVQAQRQEDPSRGTGL